MADEPKRIKRSEIKSARKTVARKTITTRFKIATHLLACLVAVILFYALARILVTSQLEVALDWYKALGATSCLGFLFMEVLMTIRACDRHGDLKQLDSELKEAFVRGQRIAADSEVWSKYKELTKPPPEK